MTMVVQSVIHYENGWYNESLQETREEKEYVQLGKVKRFSGGGGIRILDLCVEMGMRGDILASERSTNYA